MIEDQSSFKKCICWYCKKEINYGKRGEDPSRINGIDYHPLCLSFLYELIANWDNKCFRKIIKDIRPLKKQLEVKPCKVNATVSKNEQKGFRVDGWSREPAVNYMRDPHFEDVNCPSDWKNLADSMQTSQTVTPRRPINDILDRRK